MDSHTKSQRQSLQSVLYCGWWKDVWVMEKTAVFCSAHVLAVRSVISWILGLNLKPLFIVANVGLLRLSTLCSHCKHLRTMTDPDDSTLTLIAVDQSGCSRRTEPLGSVIGINSCPGNSSCKIQFNHTWWRTFSLCSFCLIFSRG